MVESWPARLVGERTAGVVGVAYAVLMAVNGGSELLIFVPRMAHRCDLSLSSAYSGMSSWRCQIVHLWPVYGVLTMLVCLKPNSSI